MVKKITNAIKTGIIACDLFSTTEILRINQNPQYKSFSGGVCSIAVIIAFTIIFTQTILNTFQKSTVTSSTTIFQDTDPSLFTTDNPSYMFALGINGVNLNNITTKFFNVSLIHRIVNKTGKYNDYIQLIPCNKSVWLNINQKFNSTFDKLQLSNYLCFPSKKVVEFQGKYSSDIFKYLKISVGPCQITDNRSCANSTQIDNIFTKAGGSLSFNYYFVNTIINADDLSYLGQYFQDKNYFQFSPTLGSNANIFISSFSIQTDQSLWPWKDIKQDTGGIVYQMAQTFVFKPTTDYLTLYIRKSSLSLFITRLFTKYDDTLSYIGGLFSTFMVLLLIVNKYNQYSYQLFIASKIYILNKSESIPYQKFNILKFFPYCIYCLLVALGFQINCQNMKKIDDSRQEIGKQLDIMFILRKLRFFQKCMSYLFQDYQFKCLQLNQHLTLEQATYLRKQFYIKQRLLKLNKKYKIQQKSNKQKSKENISSQNNKFNQIQSQNKNKDINKNYQNITIIHQQQISQSNQKQEQNLLFYKQFQQSFLILKTLSSSNDKSSKIFNNIDPKIKRIFQIASQQKNYDTSILKTEEIIKLNTSQQHIKPKQQAQLKNLSFQFIN